MMLVNASGNKMRHDEALKVVTNLNQEAFKTMYDMFSSLASKTATPAPAAMPAPTPPAPAPVPDQSSTRAVAPMSKINMRPLGRQQDQMSDTQAPPGGRVVTGATTGRVSGLELTNTDRPNQIGQELADTLDGYPESYANDPRMAEDLAALVMRVVTGATGGY